MEDFLIGIAVSTLFIVPLLVLLVWVVERAAAMGHKRGHKGQQEDAPYEHEKTRLQPAKRL